MSGQLLFVFTSASPGEPMTAVDEAVLEAGRGLVGDRYHRGHGTFSEALKGESEPDHEITLIESEEIERFNRDYGQSLGYGDARRNLVTSGVRLNELVGRRFRIGGALLEGIRLCEPCAHLARTVNAKVLPGLVHKAGLRARIVESAAVRLGDAVADVSSE